MVVVVCWPIEKAKREISEGKGKIVTERERHGEEETERKTAFPPRVLGNPQVSLCAAE